VERFGGVDVVFANAGITVDPPATIAGVDAVAFERVIEVDLLGMWRTVRAALPQVIERRGHVLVTASCYSFLNGMLNAAYAMSKAGVEQFGRALRSELAVHGATAGVLYPGLDRDADCSLGVRPKFHIGSTDRAGVSRVPPQADQPRAAGRLGG